MKKIQIFIFLVLISFFPFSVHAQHLKTDKNWTVTLSKEGKMLTNFKENDMNHLVYTMQPGDDLSLDIRIKNQNKTMSNWYMKNDIIQSLEDASKTAQNGAYTYKLSYKDKNGKETVFYDNSVVGGEKKVPKDVKGLHEATDSLKKYFYLAHLKSGDEGLVSLFIVLDGETQGNDYQNTLAELKLSFATELDGKPNEMTKIRKHKVVKTDIVKTGDRDTIFYYLGFALISFLTSCLLLLRRKPSA